MSVTVLLATGAVATALLVPVDCVGRIVCVEVVGVGSSSTYASVSVMWVSGSLLLLLVSVWRWWL